MSIHAISARQQRDIRAMKREAFIHEALPFDDEEPIDPVELAEQIEADPSRTEELIQSVSANVETCGRVYESLNRDLGNDTDAWKARQWETFIADVQDTAMWTAKDEVMA